MSIFSLDPHSKYQCGFRKALVPNTALLESLKNGKKAFVKSFWLFAFGYLSHELLTAKLSTYGFGLKALKLINK